MTKKNANILVTGVSYSEHKGSAAILTASLDAFEGAFPNAQFSICSFTPDIDGKKLKRSNVYVIPYSFKIRSLEFLLAAILVKLNKNRLPSNLPIIRKISDADIIIDLSGDTISSEYGTGSILSIGIRLISAKFLKKHTVLFCQSIGPFTGFVDRNVAKFFLKFSDLIIAREYITAKYLKDLGIKPYVCADPAFLLKPDYTSLVLPLPANKPIFGLNLSQYIDVLYGGETSDNKYRLLMANFIDCLIERYNAHIVIIPEVKKQTPGAYDDFYVSEKILNLVKNRQSVTLINGDFSSSQLKAIVSYCDIIVSPRFHLAIFALAQNIPSIAIAYIPKSYGIMEMMNQSQYVIDYDKLNLDLLMAKVKALWTDRESISACIGKRMDVMRSRVNFAVSLVSAELDET